jgi:hypothetical protein
MTEMRQRDLKAMGCKPRHAYLAILCLILLSAHAVPADKKEHEQEALQFLNRVRDATNIGAPNSPPFRLRVNVVAAPVEHASPQINGTYTLIWASPDRWREEIIFPGYHRVRVASQSTLWTSADLSFVPLRVYELNQLMDFRSQWTLQSGESVNLRKLKIHNGVGTRCAEIQAEMEPGREVCADASSLLPSRMEMILPANPLRTLFVYANYEPSGGKQFPRSMRAFEGKVSL